jgi:succinylarginine dihydrolase
MTAVEINFDGIVGPSHNFAGLSPGNLAATSNAGQLSHPRAAALEGLAKMRANLALGLTQGILLPHRRPNRAWWDGMAVADPAAAEPWLLAAAMSASPMWAANAATVSPAEDTADGRCHLTVANLQTMPHRSHEWPETLVQLQTAFRDPAFAVHGPVPPPFGDEGAANHMRLAAADGGAGVELFVYGRSGGRFPARQHAETGRVIARAHGLDPARTLHVAQSDAAIAAGAFHNDVVAVADGRTLFAHELAFADRDGVHAALRRLVPGVEIVEVPNDAVPLADAIRSYLFNAQLVTPPSGEQTLILPVEARATEPVWRWLQQMVAGNGPIRRLELVDVRQSMRNCASWPTLRPLIPASWWTTPSSTGSRRWSRPSGRSRSPPTTCATRRCGAAARRRDWRCSACSTWRRSPDRIGLSKKRLRSADGALISYLLSRRYAMASIPATLSIPEPSFVSPWAAGHVEGLIASKRRSAGRSVIALLVLFCLIDAAFIAAVVAYANGALTLEALSDSMRNVGSVAGNPLIAYLAAFASRKPLLIGTAFLWTLAVASGLLVAAVVGVVLTAAWIRSGTVRFRRS